MSRDRLQLMPRTSNGAVKAKGAQPPTQKRKTKVRIVGDPDLAAHIAVTLSDHYEFEKAPERFQRAVGRDYAHTQAPGVTVYIVVKKPKVAGWKSDKSQILRMDGKSLAEIEKEAST